METHPSEQLAVQQPVKTPVLTGDRGLKLDSLDSMWRFAVAVVNSGTFKDIGSPEVALIRLQAGLELGLTPVWALSNIFVTNGRPAVWGDALLGIVLAQPSCEDVIETFEGTFPDDTFKAVCEVKRKGRAPVIREFSVADAKKAGIWQKNVHAQYPKRMLAMRARSWACRDAFADALRGLGVREELQSIEPKPAQARVVSTPLVLPDEPDLEDTQTETGGGSNAAEVAPSEMTAERVKPVRTRTPTKQTPDRVSDVIEALPVESATQAAPPSAAPASEKKDADGNFIF